MMSDGGLVRSAHSCGVVRVDERQRWDTSDGPVVVEKGRVMHFRDIILLK